MSILFLSMLHGQANTKFSILISKDPQLWSNLWTSLLPARYMWTSLLPAWYMWTSLLPARYMWTSLLPARYTWTETHFYTQWKGCNIYFKILGATVHLRVTVGGKLPRKYESVFRTYMSGLLLLHQPARFYVFGQLLLKSSELCYFAMMTYVQAIWTYVPVKG